MDEQEPTAHERFEPEPEPEPEVSDVIEGIAAVLADAVEPAEPNRSTSRCAAILISVQAAVDGAVTPDEVLRSLRMLQRDWRES